MSIEGQTLGEFEILSRLGQGGMGAVYKARQISLDRFVALKTLQASISSDQEFIARFRREAKAADSRGASGAGADKAQALFDGRTLAGWVVGGDPGSFTVEDGCIKATGSNGNLIYTGTGAPVAWTDFDLSMKVKTENNANSGVWVHCPPVASAESAVSVEVQIYNKPGDPQSTGSIFKVASLDKQLARDGQWFDLRVVVRGLTVTVYLDGAKANEWTQPADWTPPASIPHAHLGRGSIGLQGYGGQTLFKDIRITLP